MSFFKCIITFTAHYISKHTLYIINVFNYEVLCRIDVNQKGGGLEMDLQMR